MKQTFIVRLIVSTYGIAVIFFKGGKEVQLFSGNIKMLDIGIFINFNICELNIIEQYNY